MPNGNELMPIRCGKCGHFFGFEHLIQGVVFLWCKNCKDWSMVVQDFEVDLTSPEIYATLMTRGTKSQ